MDDRKPEAGNSKPANTTAQVCRPRPASIFQRPFSVSWFRFSAPILLGAGALFSAGCSRQTLEDRAREQAEKVIEAMGDTQTRALEQKVTPEEVKQAQEALTNAHEYMGEVNGKLDAVTVNAVESFQRTHGLKDNGILNEKTLRLLREDLAAKR